MKQLMFACLGLHTVFARVSASEHKALPLAVKLAQSFSFIPRCGRLIDLFGGQDRFDPVCSRLA